MSLSPREQFKVGFLLKCAQLGLSMGQTLAVAKEAKETLAGFPLAAAGAGWEGLKNLGGAGWEGVKNVAGYGIPLAGAALIGGPLLAGGLAGGAAAHLTNLNDEDPAETKVRELIEEYSRATEQARIQNSMKQRQRTMRPSHRLMA